VKQALQQGFSSRSRWLLQILGLRSVIVGIFHMVFAGGINAFVDTVV
jgi:hypothetical protein